MPQMFIDIHEALPADIRSLPGKKDMTKNVKMRIIYAFFLPNTEMSVIFIIRNGNKVIERTNTA
jgi:hypothetical protein